MAALKPNKKAVASSKAAPKRAAKKPVKTVGKSSVKKTTKAPGKTTVKTAAKSPAKTVSKTVSKSIVKISPKKSLPKAAPKSASKSVQSAVSKAAVNKGVVSKTSTLKAPVKKTVAKFAKTSVIQSKVVVEKARTAAKKIIEKLPKKSLAKSDFSGKIVTLSQDQSLRHPTKKDISKNMTQSGNTKTPLSPSTKTNPVVPTSEVVTTPISEADKTKSVAAAENQLQEIVDPGFLANDDVFDEADHAQWQQLRELADIQSRAMQLNRPETHPDFNGKECVECGLEIPMARLKMHKVRCVDCQNELEQDRLRSQRTTYQPKGGNVSGSGWDE